MTTPKRLLGGGPSSVEAPISADVDRVDRTAAGFVTLIACGLIITVFAGAWGWQRWQERSGAPIDDRLPLLVQSDPDNDPPQIDTAPHQLPMAEAQPEPSPSADATGEALIVHVSGAVRRPGVVELDPGNRIHDAVEAAGGATDEADFDRVNLAAPVLDGDRIHLPRFGETDPPTIVPPERIGVRTMALEASALDGALVDINTASQAELETLPGVGPATASAIIELRTARGPYFGVDELLDVPGIGPSKLEQMAPWVIIGPA